MQHCPASSGTCNDNTCLKYNKHNTCSAHQFHLGDRIRNTIINKLGYVYDVNPLKTERSCVIKYDDNTFEKCFGHCVCYNIELTGDPRDTSKCNPKYL
jgi:hypothetical protein